MTHRKLFFGIVALAILLSVQTGVARAESFGKAIVPHYEMNYKDGSIHGGSTAYTNPLLYISNISNSVVTVKISFYNSDGQLIIGFDDDPLSGPILLRRAQTNYKELSDTSCTASFELEASESERIHIRPELYFSPSTNANDHGFIKISWTSTTDIHSLPLIATYEKTQYYSFHGDVNYVTTTLFVNEGVPF